MPEKSQTNANKREKALSKIQIDELVSSFTVLHELEPFLFQCVEDGSEEALDSLMIAVTSDYRGITYKHELKKASIRCAICWGEKGIQALQAAFLKSDSLANQTTIFEYLAILATNNLENDVYKGICPPKIVAHPRFTEGIKYNYADLAKAIMAELALSAPSGRDLAFLVGHILQLHSMSHNKDTQIAEQVVRAAATRWLSLSRKILNEYQNLVRSSPKSEPVFQRFFEKHPQLLDPMAVQVWPRPNLLGSRIPDFVVKRSDETYLIVEIETPGKQIMTQNGHITSLTTQAKNQAMDYRRYLLQNHLQIKATFPEFSEPDCLVIIGLEKKLNDKQSYGLSNENAENRHVRIVGFDWIHSRAMKIMENTIQHGVEVSVARVV